MSCGGRGSCISDTATLSILSSTYIVILLQPYHKNLSTELKRSSRVYLFDTWHRNFLLNNLPTPRTEPIGRLHGEPPAERR
ncbi:hypothetical protein [Candidatus Pyrohabitans sp.]